MVQGKLGDGGSVMKNSVQKASSGRRKSAQTFTSTEEREEREAASHTDSSLD